MRFTPRARRRRLAELLAAVQAPGSPEELGDLAPVLVQFRTGAGTGAPLPVRAPHRRRRRVLETIAAATLGTKLTLGAVAVAAVGAVTIGTAVTDHGSGTEPGRPAGSASNSSQHGASTRSQHHPKASASRAPGQTRTPPGQARTPPGPAKTPPGQAKKTAPPKPKKAKTPPGQAKKTAPPKPKKAKTPPGQAKKKAAPKPTRTKKATGPKNAGG